MNIVWNAARLAYAFGVGLCIRDAIDARRKAASPAPLPDSIEDQLDIMIHTTEIEENSHG